MIGLMGVVRSLELFAALLIITSAPSCRPVPKKLSFSSSTNTSFPVPCSMMFPFPHTGGQEAWNQALGGALGFVSNVRRGLSGFKHKSGYCFFIRLGYFLAVKSQVM